MLGIRVLVFTVVIFGGAHLSAQQGNVINDTLWITPNPTRPIEISRAFGKVVYIRNIIPDDLPPKQRRIQLISSVAN